MDESPRKETTIEVVEIENASEIRNNNIDNAWFVLIIVVLLLLLHYTYCNSY
jgi:hypothetical protein